MTYLKFYKKENDWYDEIGFRHEMVLSQKEVMVISAKLSRHFKFPLPELRFYGTLDSGTYFQRVNMIRVSKVPTLGTLTHELAHAYQQHKIGDSKHNKKLMRVIKKFARYIMKKNYWCKHGAIKINEDGKTAICENCGITLQNELEKIMV